MTTDPIKALEAANDKLGAWMSAALDDPKVCQSMMAAPSPDVVERERPGFAIADIAIERERQKTGEGWTLAHDDSHDEGEMALAAACYASPEGLFVYRFGYQHAWPWDSEWFKRKNRRRDLVRAAALIVAEIERLDRAALTAIGEKP